MNRTLNAVRQRFFTLDFIYLPIYAFVVLVAFACLYPQNSYKFAENCITAEIIMVLVFTVSIGFGAYLYQKGSLDEKTVIALMFLCGFAMRLAYVIKYPYSANQHDVETLNASGHLSYIFNVSNGKLLPSMNEWQFCHPPLHHFLSGIVVFLTEKLGGITALGFENVQLLTCFYSVLFMSVGYKMLKECKVHGNPLVYCFALLAFHPIFSILGGSINNDTLSILLMMYAALYLLKWYNNPTYKNAILTGLFAGLGMMTKFSVAVICVVTAFCVLIKFIFDKKLKFASLLGQASCYLCVALPLGLWYQIRNMIAFSQPLGYVAPLSTSNKLYVGDVSFAERFLMPFSSTKTEVYVDVWKEHNIWNYLLRNSLFGEYDFGSAGIAMFTVFANLMLVFTVIAALIYLIVFKRSECRQTIPLAVLFVVQFAFFIYFNIKHPFRCSMDFRYIVPVLFCSIAFIGSAGSILKKSNGAIIGVLTGAVKFVIVLLCITSVIIFI